MATGPINPKRVRYIKLGRGGSWEQECLREGTTRFGYETGSDVRFPLCRARQWDALKKSFVSVGKDKGTASRLANEARLYFEDDGSTLWLTFIGELLCWGYHDGSQAKQHKDDKSVVRVIDGGWRWKDVTGEDLTKDRLSGALTKLAAYRGTSCRVDVASYVIRRINGQKTPEVERAVVAMETMKSSTLELMRLLGPKDFEMLVDLIFSTSGWRRLGAVGNTQKTLDLDLMLPSTGERAFVQVKSKTTLRELNEYVEKLDELGPYDRMFYVYHSGSAATDDERVTLIGPEKLAELVVDAGLLTWLIRKVS